MKKIIIFVITTLFFSAPTFADDIWDSYQDTNFYGKTQAVSDEDFEKALESKKQKKNFFGFTIKPKTNKNIPKGEEFRQSDETTYITETYKDYPVITIPLDLIIDEKTILPVGHYQVEGEKENNKVYLKFYQAGELIAKTPAITTSDDYDQENVNLAECREFDENRIEIIFGSLDFNAYTLVNIYK
ncbi:hypothetical protein IJF81_02890 [bacterium]|nr:hypothetical protein [bacterium]